MTSETGRAPGAVLLDRVHTALTTFVVFPSEESVDATALWIAATHAQTVWEHAPRLGAISPEKRCGKSRLMTIAEWLVWHPIITVNISSAALVRSITRADPPTLMLDEADTVFGKKAVADQHEDLRGLLNAGHERNRPYIRWDMIKRGPESCPTFSFAMLAGIGNLPDTIMDRAILVRMRRRKPGEMVKPFRTRRNGPQLQRLRDELSEWVKDNLETLSAAEPKMPVEDRAADTWEPLVAIADLAGEDWPERARRAAEVMSAAADSEEGSLNMRLLGDVRDIFGDTHEAMHTSELLDALHKIEDAPWSELFGRPLTANNLGKRLREYDIQSTNVRIGGVQRKGYQRDDLRDAWARYLPPSDDAPPASPNGRVPVVEDPPDMLFGSADALPAGESLYDSDYDWTDVETAVDVPWVDDDVS